jgi:hypothetical protein
MTALGIIIIQNHGIDPQLNQIRLFYFQPPDKQMLQQTTKQKNSNPGKSLEKPFDLMRRKHIVYISFDRSGVSFVGGILIKMTDMAAAAVRKKTQNLFENFMNDQALFTLSDRSEISVQQRENQNSVQIPDKKCQAGSAGQAFMRFFYGVDSQFTSFVFFVMFTHKVLHLLGFASIVNALVGFNYYNSKLPLGVGLFVFINRSI